MRDSHHASSRFASHDVSAGPVMEWPPLPLHRLFEQFVDQNPVAPAIIGGDVALTRGALDAWSNRLAHALIQSGVRPEEPVGVLVERSAYLPIAFLAILKAGAVYTPLVAGQPPERLAEIVRQAGMRFLVALDGLEPPPEALQALGPAGRRLRPEDHEQQGARSDRPVWRGAMENLATVLFTSGSTGAPKGVLIRHDSCVNMARGHTESQGLTPKDRVLLAGSPGFILAYRELCLPLASGAAYVPASRGMLDSPPDLLAMMAARRVTVALLTPSYLRQFHGKAPEGLRLLITAGERPNADDARHYARLLDYWNVHGATEMCGAICMHKADPDETGPLPSGRPFWNTEVALLDADGRPVAPGELGVIHVLGRGLSPGYLGRPDLTEEHFIETPFGRAYCTRDIGRWNEAGELETFGRSDDVVKVSGQTVALGEIERALMRQDGVVRAAAIQFRGRLAAFVEGGGVAPAPRDWRAALARLLPAYMIPAQIAAVAALPVAVAGKLDRKALTTLAEQFFDGAAAATSEAPKGALETLIAAAWETALDVPAVGRHDNFFALGGTSLLAIAVSQRLLAAGVSAPAPLILATLTVADLAARLSEAAQASGDGDSAEEGGRGRATASQEDFWIAAELGFPAAASHVYRVLTAEGESPAPERWRDAWAAVIHRHPALRTRFDADAEHGVFWRTAPAHALSLAIAHDHCATAADARALVSRQLETPFDLRRPPLARAGLIDVAATGQRLFWFVVHHAVADGASARVIQDDLRVLLTGGALPPVGDGMALASRDERRYLASAQAEIDRAYWSGQIDALTARGGAAFEEFNTELSRPRAPGGLATPVLSERLDARTTAALRHIAQAHRVGLHGLLLALLAAELRRRFGREDLVIGSGVTVRPPGSEAAVGHFVNLLPIVLFGDNPAGNNEPAPLAGRIAAAQAALTGAIAHAAFPAGEILHDLRRRHPDARPAGRTALFDIALTAAPGRASRDAASGFALISPNLPGERTIPAAGVDLSFSHEPVEDGDEQSGSGQGGGIDVTLSWNADVWTQAGAGALLAAFAAWARWLAFDPRRVDQPPPALLPDEAATLAGFEYGAAAPRPIMRCHELAAVFADREPQRPAVITRDRIVCYGELDRQANHLAWRLLDAGVRRGDAVGVLSDCAPSLITAVLAIWKAGAAYLPLPQDLPGERLAYMAADAGVRAVIVPDGASAPDEVAALGVPLLQPDPMAESVERPLVVGDPADIAYFIYTSGTTGQPKGVAITHAGYVNTVFALSETADFGAPDRIALVSATGFDASVMELGLGLFLGMALVPIGRDLRDDPWALKAYYRDRGVTVAFHVPSYLRVSKSAPFEGLRVLLTGGEAPNHDDIRHHAGSLAFWNAYGPAEASIAVTMARLSPDLPATAAVPAGRPLANTRISLRRPDGTPVPPGSAGEVWIGGVGLAAGYVNRAELTAERFVDTAEGRFYRTGDLGRWSGDGQLMLAGRIDHQIKLNGQRIEPAEIEQALLDLPGVAEALVLLGPASGGAQALRGFVRLAAGAAPPDWRAELAARLPVYMIPATVMAVPVMPVTSSGKINRAALLALTTDAAGSTGEPPRAGLESRVADVWRALLGVAPSRGDDFFALGGNSLLAVALAHRLTETLGAAVPARLLFAAPTLEAFAGRVAELAPAPTTATGACDAATEGEREFRLAETAGLDTHHFTIPVIRSVEGEAPSADQWRAAWAAAWAAVVARHAALRTVFIDDSRGGLFRRVLEHVDGVFEIAEAPDRAAALAHARARQGIPFAMTEPPLWRAGLVKADDGSAPLLWLAMHHSVGDGHSVGLLLDDLLALLTGAAPPAPPAATWDCVAAREQAYLNGQEGAADADYWRKLLGDLPDEAFDDWPLDRARWSGVEPGAHRFDVRLDPAAANRLAEVARRCRASLHALMLTVLALEISRRSERARFAIGTAASVRETAEESRLAGYGVNMLPLAVDAAEWSSFAAALSAVQRGLGEALQHARYPFVRIHQDFRADRPISRHQARFPLFDFSVTEDPGSAPPPAGAKLRFSPLNTAGGAVGYERGGHSPGQDMVLIHQRQPDGGLVLQGRIDAAVYSRETAQVWFEALLGWARWLGADPANAEGPLPALLPDEAATLATWEYGGTRPRPDARMHELVERVAAATPELPAIVTPERTWSYGALNQEADRIASALSAAGVSRGDTVGVLADSAPSLPLAALAIWKTGAAYLPLARDLPDERLTYMAADAGVDVVVAPDGAAVPAPLADRLRATIRPEELDDAGAPAVRPAAGGSPEDPAYVIYTSGTTGQPKGVAIPHRGFINAVMSCAEMLGVRDGDRIAMVATPGFDASPWEIGMGFAHGLAVVPVSRDLRNDPWRLKPYYRDLGVTVAFHAPSYLRVSKTLPFEGLRTLIAGGEAPNHDDVRHHAGYLAFWNGYGPTETSIAAALAQIPLDFPPSRALPVGRPLANTRITVRRSDGRPTPPGAVGELWIGGAGVGIGYLRRPEQTAERFVVTDEGRFYRSGDLGRWTADGLLELAGRVDDQVKLNGQRVEPAEVEQVLLTHPAAAQAAVLVDIVAGAKTLRAFVRAAANSAPPDWRGWLSERLPAFMVPASVTVVPAIPTTPAGKIDRAALLSAAAADNPDHGRAAPREGLEALVAGLWSELLGAPVYRDDHFFALGGHSLLAVTAAHRLSLALGRPVAARTLFAAPTLAGFAAKLAEQVPPDPLPTAASDNDETTEGEKEFRVAEAAGLDTRHFNIPLLRAVIGETPVHDRWKAAWGALVARHESLRTFFEEDGEGVLRRRVVPTMDAAFEFTRQPTRAAALLWARERQSAPFTLAVPPLWRAGLITVDDGTAPLFWATLHHSVGDGQSLGILSHELTALLEDRPLPPAPYGWSRLAARERAYLNGAEGAADGGWWRDSLAALPDQAYDDWALDLPRSPATPPGTYAFALTLDAATSAALKAAARRRMVSLHGLMLALLALEVRRRSGRAAFTLGTVASVRETEEDARVVGCGANMLPLAVKAEPDACFADLLASVGEALGQALQRARYPFARIYRDFRADRPMARHPSRYPLFDFAVTELPSAPAAANARLRLAGVDASDDEVAGAEAVEESVVCARTDRSPAQDMVLVHEETADGRLTLRLQVNAAVYHEETGAAWFGALVDWARWLADDPERLTAPLPALTPAEQATLAAWENGGAAPRPAQRFHEVFERRFDEMDAGRRDRPAILSETGAISWKALEEAANAVAHALISRGVTPGATVAVLTGRSAALPATMLGIWKAGAIYLPLSADLPGERLAFLARDAGAEALAALDGLPVPSPLAALLPNPLRPEALSADFRAAHAHRPAATAGEPDDIAYILYTSGSTGQPKGVLVPHRGLVNTVLGAGEQYGLSADDRTLMFAAPSFDVSLSDVCVPLAFGATMCAVDFTVLAEPARFLACLDRFGVTVLDITPTYLRLFDGAPLPHVRVLVTGGEAPFAADVAVYAARCAYFNAYGPTENAITSTMARLTPQPACATRGGVSAGRPLPNTTALILNVRGERVPPGALGEIWLGGAGLARGYLNRPDLTEAAFVMTPHGRLYRSGDLGRWRADGTLEIVGRADEQVKLNGIRVELGEIESLLAAHPAIAQAAVIVGGEKGGKGGGLWAFVRLEAGAAAPPESEWRGWLAERAPSYMIPAALIEIERIPLSASGKVDRAALKSRLAALRAAAPDKAQDAEQGELDPMLLRIAAIWAEVLETPAVAPSDNFFNLGGDSLRVIAAVNRLSRAFSCRINDLYENPVLADFARVCRPRSGHLRAQLLAARADWRAHIDNLPAYETERAAALAPARQRYAERAVADLRLDISPRRDYRRALLTGATGYLGAYMLRELLADPDRLVTALTRGADGAQAHARLADVLRFYFGAADGSALAEDPRLTVIAGDLRSDNIGLSAAGADRLMDGVQAVFHCAAKVDHYGHYFDFHAANVAATRRLLDLAARQAAPPDFHHVSTISAAGRPPEHGFRLFTEYDEVPATLEDNYYVRTKQEAERLVVAARGDLPNASIHRVGNVVYAADGDALQRNIDSNAFFRQLAWFIRLGAVPDDLDLWPCHVDLTARAAATLAQSAGLANAIHHIEPASRGGFADFIAAGPDMEHVRAVDFGGFLDRLAQAADDPALETAVTGAVEIFGLLSGVAPQARRGRLEVATERTRLLLSALGFSWPDRLPAAGLARMLRAAATHEF